MAEGLMKKLLNDGDGIEIQSAGVAASNGTPASIETRQILLDYGLDFTSFRSQQLSEKLMDEFDYVFCMSRMHREAILAHMPAHREKALLLGEFLDTTNPQDIFDPYGMGKEAYKKVEQQLLVAVENILAFVKENTLLENDLD